MSNYGRIWRGNLILLQCHARTICEDSHCSYSCVLGQFVCFYLKKGVLSQEMLPSEGSRFDDPNRNTQPRMSAHHEDTSKTANRACKDQQGKCLRHFLQEKCSWGKSKFYRPILKLYPLKKIILWVIAARKLDSSPLLANNKSTDQTVMMSKPAY